MTDAIAVVLENPQQLRLTQLALTPPGDDDVVVEIEWSGISTGTERLLWSGRMPTFPGMGYPLVPGYESVGRVVAAGSTAATVPGQRVFVPGANCYGPVRGLFGGAASRVVVPARRVTPIAEHLAERGTLLALAATAYHAIEADGGQRPDLIVGHGALGRLLARLAMLDGQAPPTVWERDAGRAAGATGYTVVDPAEDPRRDYRSIYDASGDAGLLDALIGRLARGGEIVLAGFYDQRPSFAFAPAFMREVRLRVAAEWQPIDMAAVLWLVESGQLSLDGLITHRQPAHAAADAYDTAFSDAGCLRMILDWSTCQ